MSRVLAENVLVRENSELYGQPQCEIEEVNGGEVSYDEWWAGVV